ncbi:MAG: alkaline phosphatase family protein [Pirellulales bacterium]
MWSAKPTAVRAVLIVLLFIVTRPLAPRALADQTSPPRVLLIVLDGLRPDYVTADVMPQLWSLGQLGAVAERHHSAVPTVTRVNSAALASGAYPERNGLLGNQIYFPELRPAGPISTWDADQLIKVDKAEFGRLFTSTTLCDVLAAHGMPMLVCGSGSSGASFLLNHRVNGAVVTVNASYPPSIREQVSEVLGPVPEERYPNTERTAWAVNAYLQFGLDRMQPAVSALWLNEPDHSAHQYGVGAPETVAALRMIDKEIARVVAEHRRRELDVNVIVVSDHGFVTHAGPADELAALLERAGLKKSATDVVVAGAAIYINEDKDVKLPQVVELLRTQPWVGAVFTRPSAADQNLGVIPGTLSTNVIRWNHPRAADLVVEPRWSDDANAYGFPGTNMLSGEAAGHGGTSPYEIHATLIASGPAFRQGLKSTLPTGNVDVRPRSSICSVSLHRTTCRAACFTNCSMTVPPRAPAVREEQISVSHGAGTTTAHTTVVNGHRYLDFVTSQPSE